MNVKYMCFNTRTQSIITIHTRHVCKQILSNLFGNPYNVTTLFSTYPITPFSQAQNHSPSISPLSHLLQLS
ncbi:hypothetical protein LguiA_031483 [Lonicera macranthoides]